MFITLEGIEGSGKTTQAKFILELVRNIGRECILTREPGGTETGKKIRAILLESNLNAVAPLTELLLYAADRAQHIEQVIKPSLESGKIVISDRFFDATTAYQGYARKLNMDIIQQLHKIVLNTLEPDLTLIFDLPVDIGLKRAWQRIATKQDKETRFEQEAITFHESVRAGYLDLAKQNPKRFKIINANQNEKLVSSDIEKIILSFI